jgi:hypothetical protein
MEKPGFFFHFQAMLLAPWQQSGYCGLGVVHHKLQHLAIAIGEFHPAQRQYAKL